MEGNQIGNFVVNSYTTAENMLVDVLEIVPYCEEHWGVWSPKLVTILQEVCSLLDSLWRHELMSRSEHSQGSHLNITDYLECFGKCMSQRWVVFWGEKPEKVEPFEAWTGLPGENFKKDHYDNAPKLDWWVAYQDVKHDRLTNRGRATLKLTIDALAGLFLAIIRCQACKQAIDQKGWGFWDGVGVNRPFFDPFDSLDEDFGFSKDVGTCDVMRMTIESRLFTYPVGFCTKVIKKTTKVLPWGSPKFTRWLTDYESRPENLKADVSSNSFLT